MRAAAYWFSLILIFMIPWEAIVVLPGLGTMTKAIGLFVGAFWAFTVIVTGRFRRPHPFHVAVCLFVLWNAVSIFWTVDVGLTMTRLATVFQMVVLALILWDVYLTPTTLRSGLQAYILGAYVSIGSLIANYLAGDRAGAGWGRFTATGFNPNSIALILALGMPVAWHLAATPGYGKKAQLLRVLNYAYIPAAIFAISLTATRFAVVATFPAFLYGIWTFTRLRPLSRVLIFLVLAGVLLALPSLIPQSSVQRLATAGDSIRSGDLSGRVAIWEEGVAVFSEHPFFGVGGGGFPRAVESGRSAHNSFLVVLVELGMVGFVLFGIVLVMTIYHAVRQPKWASRFWLTILLVWALGNSALSWAHAKPTWLFLSLVIVGANLVVRPTASIQRVEFPLKSAGLSRGEMRGA